MKFTFLILLVLSNLLFADKIKLSTYEKKSQEYYKKYKKMYHSLPIENKKRILNSYYNTLAYDMGYTMAATRFLENKGEDARFDNKKSINKNQHKGYVTYDCGDYGINTMTYLRSIDKVTKNHKAHIEACKTLSKDKALNLKLALDHYEYGMKISNGNIMKSWNVYNTGNTKIINDRIYQMKGIIMVLAEEVKKNKIEEYRIALR